MLLHICSNIMKISLTVQSFRTDTIFSYRADMIFIRKVSKGHNPVENVSGMSVLVLCTSSDDGLYLHKVS